MHHRAVHAGNTAVCWTCLLLLIKVAFLPASLYVLACLPSWCSCQNALADTIRLL